MRILIISLVGLLFLSSVYQNDCKILWQPNVKLSWDDFEGNPDENIKTAHYTITPKAVSFIGVSFNYVKKEGKYDVVIQPYFDKCKSFYNDTTDYLILEHEQCHFNISEIYARKMRKKIKQLQNSGIYDKDKYGEIIKVLNEERYRENEEFDLGTLYGTIKEEHHKWVVKINSELDELSEFSYGSCCTSNE